jgi:muconolactone delta-isomerase
MMEFLVQSRFELPPQLDKDAFDALSRCERERAVVLQELGTLRYLWREPGRRGSWSVCQDQPDDHTADAARLDAPDVRLEAAI